MPHKRQQNWWKQRTKLEKQLSCLAIISLFSALILLITLFFYKMYGEPGGICLTPGCVQAASNILKNIDERVPPCDNFYKFACGNFKEHAQIPEEMDSVSTITMLRDVVNDQVRSLLEEPISDNDTKPIQAVKNFYRACMNKDLVNRDGLLDARTFLNVLGGWPVTEEAWDENSFDWANLTISFKNEGLDAFYLFLISSGINWKEANQRIITIEQPTLGISREYLIQGINNKIVKAYYDLMVDFAILFNANVLKASDEMLEVINFEVKLAEMSISMNEQRNFTAFDNTFTLSEISKSHKNIPWVKLLKNVLPKKVRLPDDKRLWVLVPSYLDGLDELLESTPKKVLANYLFWRVVWDITDYLPQKFLDRLLTFEKSYLGVKEDLPRIKKCITKSIKINTIILGSMYVKRYTNNEAKEYAIELLNYIVYEFKKIVEQVEWMDDETRKGALAKIDKLTGHIGYPVELLIDEKINEYYKGLDTNEKLYLQSYLNINKFKIDQTLHTLLEPVNKSSWQSHSNSLVINAFYVFEENSINLPAAILQNPLFSKDRPSYLNYGAIGSILGHELTHGFDDQGRQFDENGNLVDWWEQETENAFFEKTQCIVKQYSTYYIPEATMNVSGFKTQGENIADNGGIKESYLAYTTWIKNNGREPRLPGLKYTPRQLFWIAAAQIWCGKDRPELLSVQLTTDVHTPAEYRVIGNFKNQDSFARDFNCPLGSNMNPRDKCIIW